MKYDKDLRCFIDDKPSIAAIYERVDVLEKRVERLTFLLDEILKVVALGGSTNGKYEKK